MEFVPNPIRLIMAFILVFVLAAPLPLTFKMIGIMYVQGILILFAPVIVPL